MILFENKTFENYIPLIPFYYAIETSEKKEDMEKGKSQNSNKPPCDEIIPIFRRDCHQEVFAGSHLYPGRGVYLLKDYLL